MAPLHVGPSFSSGITPYNCVMPPVWVVLLLALSLGAADPDYEKQLLKWRADRLAELTADDGWLTVVGLFWMHQGQNHAGSSGGMDWPWRCCRWPRC